jgi:hypothetical protein
LITLNFPLCILPVSRIKHYSTLLSNFRDNTRLYYVTSSLAHIMYWVQVSQKDLVAGALSLSTKIATQFVLSHSRRNSVKVHRDFRRRPSQIQGEAQSGQHPRKSTSLERQVFRVLKLLQRRRLFGASAKWSHVLPFGGFLEKQFAFYAN